MDLVGYVNLIENRIIKILALAWGGTVAENNQILFNGPFPGSPEKQVRSDADFPEVVIRFTGMPSKPLMVALSGMTFGDVAYEGTLEEPGERCNGIANARFDWKVKVTTRDVKTDEVDALVMTAYQAFLRRGPTMADTPGVTMLYFGSSVKLVDDEGGTIHNDNPDGTSHNEATISIGVDVELQWSEMRGFNPAAPANPPE